VNTSAPLQKHELRTQIRERRIALDHRSHRSQLILDRLTELLQYRTAEFVLAYIGHRSEVQTLPLIEQRLRDSQPTSVPWCERGCLQLFRLDDLDQLAAGNYGISEPRTDLRTESQRRVDVSEVDAILVPGIAFDRSGGRLGQGKGYYDKLLQQAKPGTTLIGLAYDCQIVESIPREEHDVLMHLVVTESETIGQD